MLSPLLYLRMVVDNNDETGKDKGHTYIIIHVLLLLHSLIIRFVVKVWLEERSRCNHLTKYSSHILPHQNLRLLYILTLTLIKH